MSRDAVLRPCREVAAVGTFATRPPTLRGPACHPHRDYLPPGGVPSERVMIRFAMGTYGLEEKIEPDKCRRWRLLIRVQARALGHRFTDF